MSDEGCDCLNECGDDGRVAAGKVKCCPTYMGMVSERERSQAMQELSRVLRAPWAQDVIGNGLAYIIREYPERADQARLLISLVNGRLP